MKLKLKTLLWISFFFTELVSGQSFPNPASLSTGQGPIGSLDPNWEVSTWYTNNPPNPIGLTYSPALINNNCAPGAWVTPSRLPAPINNGNWITGSDANCGTNLRDGYRYFRLKLNLPALCNGKSIANTGNYVLKLSGYVDNIISDVFVNGTSKGIRGGDYVLGGQLNMSLSGPWIAGINYIDVLVNNMPNNDINPYGLLLVADYSASLNTDTDGDGISDLLDACPCEPGTSANGCCTAPQVPTGATNQYFCSSATIADINVTGTSIKWYDAATGDNLIPSTTKLVNGNTYYAASVINSCESSTRLAVKATIQNTPEITASATEVCMDTQVNLKINNSSQSLSQFQLANPDLILFKTIGSHSYFYKNQATTWPGAKIHGDQIGASMYIINDANEELSVYNALPSRGNDGIQYWIGLYQDLSSSNYSEPSGGWKWVDNSPLQYTNWYTGEPNNTENSENFGQIEWNVFGMKWNDAGDPSNNSCRCTTAFPIYEIENLSTYSYLWSTGETTSSINPKPLVTTTYWVDATTNGSTCRKSITITVKNTPAPTGAAKQQFCNDSTIAALAVNGTAVKWYASATGTTALNNITALVNGTTYFATQTIDGCESSNRFQTTVSILKIPTPKGDGIQKFCLEENPVISNLIATGNSIIWFDALTNGMIIDNATLIQDNTTYFATTLDAATGCESLQRLAVKVDLFKCDITTYNLITINGNSLNDQLTFEDISYFPDNSVKIYNRYGKLVWETTGYDNTNNAFKGKANVSSVYMKDSFLPAGTYFYILVYNNTYTGKQTELTGYLQIDNAN